MKCVVSIRVVRKQRKSDDKACAFAEFTLDFYLAAHECYHLVHVGQSEAETFHIVAVSGRDTVESFKNLFEVLAFYPYAVVGDGDSQLAGRGVGGGYSEAQRLVLLTVFHCIVKQIEDYVGEVHLIDVDNGIAGIKVCGKAAAIFFHFKPECIGYVGNQRIGIDVLEAQSGFLFVEHRHLQHFFHLEAESHR